MKNGLLDVVGLGFDERFGREEDFFGREATVAALTLSAPTDASGTGAAVDDAGQELATPGTGQGEFWGRHADGSDSERRASATSARIFSAVHSSGSVRSTPFAFPTT